MRGNNRIWQGLGAATLATVVLAACGSSSPSGGGGSSSSSASGPAIVIGTGADFVPLSFKDPNNPDKFQGFEIDMMNAIMQHLNRQYQVQAFQFAGLIPALQAKHIDVVVDDLYIKPDREKVVDFVPYLQSGLSVMVRSADSATVHAYSDLCGKTVGGLTGSP